MKLKTKLKLELVAEHLLDAQLDNKDELFKEICAIDWLCHNFRGKLKDYIEKDKN